MSDFFSLPKEQVDRIINLYRAGLFLETLSELDTLILVHPKNAFLHNLRGSCYAKIDRKEQAISSFRTAISNEPIYEEAYNNLAIILAQNNQEHEAIKYFERALKINPSSAETYKNLGITMTRIGQFQDAINTYVKALTIDPNCPEIHFQIGINLDSIGNSEEALGYFKRVIEIQPNHVGSLILLGNKLKESGKLEEAIKTYKKAVQIQPDLPEGYYNIGTTLSVIGKNHQAIKYQIKALKIKPDFVEALLNLGLAFKEIGQLESAVKSYENALKIRPKYLDVLYNLGIVLTELGQFEMAEERYKQVLEINPVHPGTRHMLNSLLGKKSKSAPRAYIQNLFDGYAFKFERNLVDKLKYNIPLLMKQRFNEQNHKNVSKIMDLGCGTGLCGSKFRNEAEFLYGIDLSEKMIIQASKKNIYDDLYVSDLISGLNHFDMVFDLFLAADVFIYIGDLFPLFKVIRQYTNPNSLFIFSTENSIEKDFNLQPNGRFSHSKNYIEEISTKTGFKINHFECSNLRKEKGKWITGGLYILKII